MGMNSALLIIDMINNLKFPQGEKLLQEAAPVAENIAEIKKLFKRHQLPVIYVNDNFGNWKSSWEEVFEHCTCSDSLGRSIAKKLRPDKDDYFVLKPKHSGFYCSNLDVLLNDLKIDHLVITGMAGNICVLFTVNDAYMRGYKIHVPANAIASENSQINDFALTQFRDVFNINIDNLTDLHQILSEDH